MRRTTVAICGSLLVCGCSGLDPSKLVPSAAAGFQKAVTGVTTTETNLISAFQQENQSLLFLSANTYSCGDPNEPTVRRYLGAKDPASLVSNEHINKYWAQSLKYLASYVKLLNVIVGNAQSSVSDIDATVSAGTFAASIIPGIQSPAAGAALKALGAVAKDAANLVAEGYLIGAAQAAARPLAVAVGYLQKYYPAFEGNELLAFNAWDECAHEKLAFIRDNPFGRVPGYPTPFFAPSDGVELDAAYAAWRTQRQAYISAGTIPNAAATLKQILIQNSNLANPAIGLNLQSAQTSVQTITSVYNDLAAAQKAMEGLIQTKKPKA
jgi:hypothetical protein